MKHFLLIDDDKDILELISDDLEDQGYKASTYDNAQEAIDSLYDDKPDLVICDLMMPGISGFETFKVIKQVRPDIPFYIFSGHITPNVYKSLVDLGVTGIVEKPTATKDLLAVVEESYSLTHR